MENHQHCKIGKVHKKNNLRIISSNNDKSLYNTRVMLLDIIKIIDKEIEANGADGEPIMIAMSVLWPTGGTDICYAYKKEFAENQMPHMQVNFRELSMLFEDMARDLREYSLYDNPTPIKIFKANEEGQEET